jgi:ATP-dependent RNA helicase DBP3
MAIRKKFDMTVHGCGLAPIMNFAHTGLDADLLACTAGFTTPSAIQAQSWPVVLSGRDLVGIASTGSGKTLAFGVPGMAHIRSRLKEGLTCGKGRPVMLAIAPTRELACQIQDVLEDAGKGCGIRSLCAYGGVPKSHQVRSQTVPHVCLL